MFLIIVQLTNSLQQSDMNVGLYTQVIEEGQFIFNESQDSILQIHFSARQKQIIIIQDDQIYFIDIRTNQIVYRFGKCQFEQDQIQFSYLDEKTNILILASFQMLCSISLTTMQVLQNKKLVDICPKIKYINSDFSNNKDGYVQLMGEGVDYQYYYVIINIEDFNPIYCGEFYRNMYYSLMSFDQESQTQFIITSSSDMQVLTVADYKLNPIKKHFLPQNQDYECIYFLCKQYALITNLSGLGVFVSLETFEILLSKQYFSTNITNAEYDYETELLLISSSSSNFQLSKLDIETGEEIIFYQKQICNANNLKVMHEMDIFVITCLTILEDDNTFIKILKLSTGELINTIKTNSFIKQSIFIQPFDILMYEVEYFSDYDLQCEVNLVNLSHFQNPTQTKQNDSRQTYFISFIWQQDLDIYFVASREGNIYEYQPEKSKFQLIEVCKNQILAFERIKFDMTNRLAYIQLPSKIMIYNLQLRQTIYELNFKNNLFLQLKHNYLIVKKPYTIYILSQEFQLIKELTLSNKINEVQIISLQKEYILVTSFDGFVSLINIENQALLWKKQTEQNRIQGICINQYFTILITFSREQKLNIFLVNKLYDGISLKASIQLKQSIKNVFIIENKIIITYFNFRYIDIYEYAIKNELLTIKFKDFLILPFKIQNYFVQIMNQNSQLIVYSDFKFAIYDLGSNQIVFKSSKSYFSNKIVQITSISNSMFLISCEQDIEVVEINTESKFSKKDYSIWKSLSLISSNNFKVFNTIKKYNSDTNLIEYLILIGAEVQSIKNYEVQLIDFSDNNNSEKGCHISFKSVSYYDLDNKFKSLYDLNKNEFNSYRIKLIVEQDNNQSIKSIPQFVFQNQTTLIFDGTSNGNLIDIQLKNNLVFSLNYERVEFINFNLIVIDHVLFSERFQKTMLIKDCTLIKNVLYDFVDQTLLKFFHLRQVEINNLNINNISLDFSYIISFDGVSEVILQNIYLTDVTLKSTIGIFCDSNVIVKIQNIVIENNFFDSIDQGSQMFQFHNIQYLYMDNLKINSNKGVNKISKDIFRKSTIINLINCQNIDYYNTQFIENENLILFSVLSKLITNMLEVEEIIIYKLIIIFIQDISIQSNLNNDFPLIYFDSILDIFIQQAKIIQNECTSSILNFISIQTFKIDTIIFEKNIGNTGIEIIDSPSISIKNGSFQSNIGILSGGVFKIKNSELIINEENQNTMEQCQFIQNTALYQGGAIYLENSKLNINQSYFQENIASIGGAIRYTRFQPKFITQQSNNKYHKNKALLFGQNIGSYPKFAVVDSRRKISEHLISDYRSGDTINNFLIYILDEEKNIINTKYEEELKKIMTNFQKQTRLNQQYIQECYKNATQLINDEIEQYVITVISANDNILSVSNMTIFQYGSINDYFELSGLVIYGIPEQSGEILFQTPFIKDFKKDGSLYDNSNHSVFVLFRKCIRGELYQKRTDTLYTCDRCLDNRYSLIEPNVTDTSQICKQCSSENTESCEVDKILLKKGYWRESVSTDEILYCENSPSNCEGTESTQYCSQGYIGPLCEECDNYGEVWGKPYAREYSFGCKDCNKSYLIYLKISLVTVSVSIYFYITVKKQLERSCKRAICIILRQTNMLAINMSCQRNEEINSIQKLLIHFLQITSVMIMNQKLHFDFHEITSIFGQPQTIVSSSFDCILSQQRYIPIHYTRAVYGLFLPIQYIGVSILLQSIFWLFFRFQLKKQFIISSINFGILFFQTGIVKALIDIIFCRKIGSKFYIKSQINQECYAPEHLDYIYKYFLPLSLLLVFILPLLVFYSLRRNKQRLKYNASAIIKYGLFFLDYKEKTYYWEFIKILLRLMIILVMNLFDQYTQVKYDTCILILITYNLFILKLQPYFLAQLNQYDMVQTSMTIILFMIERIVVSESNISNIFTTIFFIILFGVWSFFVYILIKTFIISKVLLSLKKFTSLQKYFKIKESPNAMRKFILWKKLRNNLIQVSQQIQQNNRTSKTLKTITFDTESSVQKLRPFKDSPIRKLSRLRSFKQNNISLSKFD